MLCTWLNHCMLCTCNYRFRDGDWSIWHWECWHCTVPIGISQIIVSEMILTILSRLKWNNAVLNWAEISHDYQRFHHVNLGYITDEPVVYVMCVHALVQWKSEQFFEAIYDRKLIFGNENETCFKFDRKHSFYENPKIYSTILELHSCHLKIASMSFLWIFKNYITSPGQ